MKLDRLFEKIKGYSWSAIVRYCRNKKWYYKIYSSYWHYVVYGNKPDSDQKKYYTAVPNRGAGIGHQMANWIAGYKFAKTLGLNFAHTPFANSEWDEFLGFGNDEVSVDTLVKKNGYKKILIPQFYEDNNKEVDLVKNIIASYGSDKIVFVSEQDQALVNQYEVMGDLKRKFYNATSRKNEKLIYNAEYVNIAVHIRRGDIVVGQTNGDSNLVMRWQNTGYFVNVLTNLMNILKTNKPIAIYLFSQGQPSDFPEFERFEKMHYCFDQSAQESFLHMVYADILITSKSSFSYKPALLNNGIKICPRNFWHGYPDSSDWILTDEDGTFDTNILFKNL